MSAGPALHTTPQRSSTRRAGGGGNVKRLEGREHLDNKGDRKVASGMDGKRRIKKRRRVGGSAEMKDVQLSCGVIVSKIQERVMTQGGGMKCGNE